MDYGFFAVLSRMKYIERWGLMRSSRKENVSEHSLETAQISHALAIIRNTFFGGKLNADKIATLAVYHETCEVITGDLPTPVKYHDPEITRSYKNIEKLAVKKVLKMLPSELAESYKPYIDIDTDAEEFEIIKAADKLSAYVKCLEEERTGNSEFSAAKKTIEAELAAIPLPEVKYFIDNFIGAYSKTLDFLFK